MNIDPVQRGGWVTMHNHTVSRWSRELRHFIAFPVRFLIWHNWTLTADKGDVDVFVQLSLQARSHRESKMSYFRAMRSFKAVTVYSPRIESYELSSFDIGKAHCGRIPTGELEKVGHCVVEIGRHATEVFATQCMRSIPLVPAYSDIATCR